MREIKFRVWLEDKDIPEGYMVDGADNLLITTRNGSLVIENSQGKINHYKENQYILLQYTGLKDKNGKEIYEGDIFDCIYNFDGCKKHKLQVYWNDVSAGFFLKDIGECHQPNVRKTLGDMERMEIIGNIYENSKLLK